MIGDTLEADLAAGREEAESRMSETVTIGLFKLERAPGSLDTAWVLKQSYYSGRARIKYPYATSLSKAPAGQQIEETSIVVSIPHGSANIPSGAMVRVDVSTVDSRLVGRMLRVEGRAQAGQTTAHRYPVVEES